VAELGAAADGARQPPGCAVQRRQGAQGGRPRRLVHRVDAERSRGDGDERRVPGGVRLRDEGAVVRARGRRDGRLLVGQDGVVPPTPEPRRAGRGKRAYGDVRQ
jgi:hypothetical protein